VLVFQRTDSALLSAITFALSYLPQFLGGPVLSALADRLPRHRVLIASDVVRAVLVALMALPGMPLPVLLGLLFLVSLANPPFESARSALMADVLDGDRYAVATSLTGITVQVSQLAGFVLGGALMVVGGASGALLLNAATFLVSALWLSASLERRPAPTGNGTRTTLWADAVGGIRFLAGQTRLVAIIAVVWTAALFSTAPEGIAAAWTAELGGGPTATGLLLAAYPAGTTVAGLALARLVSPRTRHRVMAPLVVLSLAGVLVAGLLSRWADPGHTALALTIAVLLLGGIGGACAIPLNVAFVQGVPAAFRGRATGVAIAGLWGVQGLGAVLAGIGAEVWRPSTVVAAAGAAGLLVVAVPLTHLARTGTSAGGSREPRGDAADPGPVTEPADAEGRSGP
jgi:MFS family permease